MDHIEEPAREGFLYHLWVERPFQNVPLRTVDGRTIVILEKGVRNRDAGPDFLDALIKIDDRLQRGDVEIHPVAGDWYAHGHHRDPKYNRVVLHVVTLDCPTVFRTINAEGAAVATLNMDDYLEKSAEELEVEAVMTDPPVQECALSRENETVIRQVLDAAGDRRLQSKAARYAERPPSQGWDQAFYAVLLEALGYSKNSASFRQLADALPVDLLWSLIWNDPDELALRKCEAYLFGAAGLLPSQTPEELPSPSPYLAELEALWHEFPLKQKLTPLKPSMWLFFRLRPANFPTRRVAAAAALVHRFRNDGFVEAFKPMQGTLTVSKIIRELEQLFTLEERGYWADHYTFEDDAKATGEFSLLGGERARDIVVNVLLPGALAYATESGDGRLQNRVWEVYRGYPRLQANEMTRAVTRQLFGIENSGLVTGARRQQGLIYLYKQLCRPLECDLCLQLNRERSV